MSSTSYAYRTDAIKAKQQELQDATFIDQDIFALAFETLRENGTKLDASEVETLLAALFDIQKDARKSIRLLTTGLGVLTGAPLVDGAYLIHAHETGDDSYTLTYYFEPGITRTQAKHAITAAGFALDGVRCTHSYDCCGGWYHRSVGFSRDSRGQIASVHIYRNV